MPTYLDTAKIQSAGRISLSNSALRNLNVTTGDSVEIYFDEQQRVILIRREQNLNDDNAVQRSSNNTMKKRK